MEKYGDTIRDFKSDGFIITDRIKVSQRSATNKDIINSMSVQMNSAYLTLTKIKPDIVMILGDRYDIYPIALCRSQTCGNSNIHYVLILRTCL